ncbi:MAG: TVP38/TMEM64 family protein [Clostridia bacterium]|nr:TVP38/TMEM64 family protein [Clostridia bacterium]
MTLKAREKMKLDEKQYRRRRKIISGISFTLLCVLFGVVCFYAKPLMELVAEPERFRAWIEGQGLLGYVTFVAIMCLQVVIAVIPGEVVEIGAGYAFGAILGMLLCLVGVAIGSAIIYGFTKLFGYKMVEAFISREKIQSLKFIQSSKRLNLLVFLLFLIPGTPKDIITYFIGLTPMKLRTFLLILGVARIPSVISSTMGGHALGLQNYMVAVIVFTITAAMSLIGILIYRRICRKENQAEN